MAKEQGRKLGAGHASAMSRAGLKEVAQVLPAFPSQSIQPVEEAGLVGTATPQEVMGSKGDARGYEAMLSGRATAPPQPQRQEEMER